MAKNFNLEIIKSKTGKFHIKCKKIKHYRVNIYYLCNSRPLNNCYMKEMSQNDLKLGWPKTLTWEKLSPKLANFS